MGIRIHTVLGYGFRYTRGQRDPRFNPWVFEGRTNHPELGNIHEINNLRPLLIQHVKVKLKALGGKPKKGDDPFWIERMDMEHLLCHLEEKGLWEPAPDKEKGEPITFYDIVKSSGYATEESIHSVIFTDPLAKDWSRYDDIIDYYSGPDAADGGIMDSVKMLVGDGNLPRPIYPWEGIINRHTGKRVVGCDIGGCMNRKDLIDAWAERPAAVRKHFGSKLKENGITSRISFQRDIVPYIPTIITAACEVLGVFKNPLTVYRLKPMLYRYWC